MLKLPTLGADLSPQFSGRGSSKHGRRFTSDEDEESDNSAEEASALFQGASARLHVSPVLDERGARRGLGGDASVCCAKTELLQLRRRLSQANEENERLRDMVAENNAKIEQLRKVGIAATQPSRDGAPFPTLQMHLFAGVKQESEVSSKQREELEKKAASLERHLEELKATNSSLRCQSRRLAGCLAGERELDCVKGVQRIVAESAAEEASDVGATANAMIRRTDAKADVAPLALASTPQGVTKNVAKVPPAGSRAKGCSAVAFAIEERRAMEATCSNSCAALWRQSDLGGFLLQLLDGAAAILGSRATRSGAFAGPAPVLYLVEDWLRDAAESALNRGGRQHYGNHGVHASSSVDVAKVTRDDVAKKWNAPLRIAKGLSKAASRLVSLTKPLHTGPTTYYLAGMTTLHGYQKGQDAILQRPLFSDLSALPMRSFSAVALPLQIRSGQPVMAVLQISNRSTANSDVVGRSDRGGESDGTNFTQSGSNNAGGGSGPVLGKGQLAGLDLLCSMAANILQMHRRIYFAGSLRLRAQACLRLTAEVNCAKDVAQFEQHAKQLMAGFFGAASARVSWHNPLSRELLTTETGSLRGHCSSVGGDGGVPAIGRRNITRRSLQQAGITGKACQARRIFRLPPGHPVDTQFGVGSGVDASDRVAGQLVGPMIARYSNGVAEAVGVIHLFGKMSRGVGQAFTDEDELFFGELLKILGLAARRTMRLQAARFEAQGDVAKSQLCLERLMLA